MIMKDLAKERQQNPADDLTTALLEAELDIIHAARSLSRLKASMSW